MTFWHNKVSAKPGSYTVFGTEFRSGRAMVLSLRLIVRSSIERTFQCGEISLPFVSSLDLARLYRRATFVTIVTIDKNPTVTVFMMFLRLPDCSLHLHDGGFGRPNAGL
ncbi:hypothetical protein QMZ05_19235 [Bradyrhizobium sp. INPA03-11B]|uniref:hypothetical protein n=1 Tax=Bradyrhizobium sp. INPA03-11B TaxID=418598 RepID=UPI00339033A5